MRDRCSGIHDVNFARVVHPCTIGWNQIDSRLRYTYQSNCQYGKAERETAGGGGVGGVGGPWWVSEERMARGWVGGRWVSERRTQKEDEGGWGGDIGRRGGICQAYSLITLLPFFNLQPTLSNVGTYTAQPLLLLLLLPSPRPTRVAGLPSSNNQ